MRQLLRPTWLLWHVTAVAGAAGMTLLGRWQLHRGEVTHSFQNYGYAGQWWCFAVFALWFWARTVRDARRPPAPQRATPVRPPVLAQAPVRLTAEDEADEEVVAYNAYLARLAGSPRR